MIWNMPQLADCSAAARSRLQAASSRAHSPFSAARVLRLVPLRVAEIGPLRREPAARQTMERVPFEQDLRPRRVVGRNPEPAASTVATARSAAASTSSDLASVFQGAAVDACCSYVTPLASSLTDTTIARKSASFARSVCSLNLAKNSSSPSKSGAAERELPALAVPHERHEPSAPEPHAAQVILHAIHERARRRA